MRPSRRASLPLAVLSVLGVVLGVSPGGALPLFARSEGARCSRCHVSPPVLNPYGLRFMGDGYRVPGEAAHARAPLAPLPVSLLAELGYRFERVDTVAAGGVRGRRNAGEFGQYLLEAHAAGTLSERVSFGIEASLDSTGSVAEAPEVFVQFDDLLGDGLLALKLGRWDSGLPFLAEARDPLGGGYLAPIELEDEGIELNGAHAGWSYAGGLCNSARAPTPAPGGTHSLNRLEDGYAWLMREDAEQLVGARVLFDHQDSNVSFHGFVQRLQLEAGASLGTDRFRVTPAYLLDRLDDRPAAGIHQRHQYLLLETIAVLDEARCWSLSARLEHEHTTPTVLTPVEDRDLEALRLANWVTPATRVALGLSHGGDNVAGPRSTRVEASVLLAY